MGVTLLCWEGTTPFCRSCTPCRSRCDHTKHVGDTILCIGIPLKVLCNKLFLVKGSRLFLFIRRNQYLFLSDSIEFRSCCIASILKDILKEYIIVFVLISIFPPLISTAAAVGSALPRLLLRALSSRRAALRAERMSAELRAAEGRRTERESGARRGAPAAGGAGGPQRAACRSGVFQRENPPRGELRAIPAALGASHGAPPPFRRRTFVLHGTSAQRAGCGSAEGRGDQRRRSGGRGGALRPEGNAEVSGGAARRAAPRGAPRPLSPHASAGTHGERPGAPAMPRGRVAARRALLCCQARRGAGRRAGSREAAEVPTPEAGGCARRAGRGMERWAGAAGGGGWGSLWDGGWDRWPAWELLVACALIGAVGWLLRLLDGRTGGRGAPPEGLRCPTPRGEAERGRRGGSRPGERRGAAGGPGLCAPRAGGGSRARAARAGDRPIGGPRSRAPRGSLRARLFSGRGAAPRVLLCVLLAPPFPQLVPSSSASAATAGPLAERLRAAR